MSVSWGKPGKTSKTLICRSSHFSYIMLSTEEAIQQGIIEDPNIKLRKPKKLCRGLRYDLKKCLLATDCCKVDKRLPIDCLRDPSCPDECVVLARGFFECKRQWVDMRKRFRGNVGY